MPVVPYLRDKAERMFPELIETMLAPQGTVTISQDEDGKTRIRKDTDYFLRELNSGEEIILDFGDHQTGYLTLELEATGHHPDAPAWMELQFAENPREFFENPKEYRGWISSGWIQTEQVHVDLFPTNLTLPRRYAFRYVKIRAISISRNYHLIVREARVKAVSSADDSKLLAYETEDTRAAQLDRLAVRTLHECMQKVFEDGPKRDRRLWLGDLRMEALVNYETYQQNDLVKLCLYLFASDVTDQGQVASNVFIEPQIEADFGLMFDYSLFFISTLLEYYRQSQDRQTLEDLYPTAMKQLELAARLKGRDGIIGDISPMGICFVDWNLDLDKTASAQGIYLYCLKDAIQLANCLGDEVKAQALTREYGALKSASREYFLDSRTGVFVSGEQKQISWASQCWLILGGAVDSDEGACILHWMEQMEEKEVSQMVSPYMYHVYVDALIECGQKEKALAVLKEYWGGMADEGADTFWELYNPKNPQESPYGGTIVNSYCHAWSCAPAYFLRKYYQSDRESKRG